MFASDTSRYGTPQTIYALIRSRHGITQAEIADQVGVSAPTVSKYLSRLIDDGLVYANHKLASGARGGRKASAYTADAFAWLAVGVDITADDFTIVVVNLDYAVLYEERTTLPFSFSPEYFAIVAEGITEVVAQSRFDHSRYLGIGVAVPGIVRGNAGPVSYGGVIPNAGLTAQDISRHLNFPVRLIHDSDAAGMVEFVRMDGVTNAFCISLSRSVGGSALLNGQLYRGEGYLYGEVGHLLIHPGDKLCYCGQRGCIDPYVNAYALSKVAGGDLGAFFKRLEAGDPEADAVWACYLQDLAATITNVRVMMGCDIVLSGDVGRFLSPYMESIRQMVDDLNYLKQPSSDYLSVSSCTTPPVATGAAITLVDEFFATLEPIVEGEPEIETGYPYRA